MSEMSVTGADRLPDRARDAMLTMDLRRKRAMLQAAEERANGLGIDAAVAELRARLGRTLADRRRMHDAQLATAREEAEQSVKAARARAEQILADAARGEPQERNDPAWWPSATDATHVAPEAVPPVDELLRRRERARAMLARPVEPTVVAEPEPELPPAALAAPVDPWQQYGPPAPSGFDSDAFAAALAVALAPLLEGSRSAPQQIVLRPMSPQRKPTFKATAGHLDVVLAFVALAIVLSVFVAWMA